MAESRLSPYTMPFAWTAKRLFDTLATSSDTTSAWQLYKCDRVKQNDEDVAKFLQDLARPEKCAKLATMAACSIDVRDLLIVDY